MGRSLNRPLLRACKTRRDSPEILHSKGNTPTLQLQRSHFAAARGSFEITNGDNDDDKRSDSSLGTAPLNLQPALLSPTLQSLPYSLTGSHETKQSVTHILQANDNGCHRGDDVCRDRVVWDEENLHELETSKTPKQKITEPKTPYYAPDGAGDGGLSPTPNNDRMQLDSASHAEAVRHALFDVATEEKASSSQSSGGNASEEEEDYMERDNEGSNSDIRRSGSFEEHRRKHYDNEYRKAKLLASQSELAADDDEAAANGEDESVSVAVKRSLQL